METKIEKLSGNQVKVIVKYTAEEFKPYYDKALDEEVAKAEVPGFRKGKYPKDKYVANYGDRNVCLNAADHLINNSYYKAVMDNKLEVLEDPKIDVDFEKLLKEKVLEYVATVTVFPTVEVENYMGVEVKKDPETVKAAEVNAYIQQQLEQKADLVLVEDKDAQLEKGETATFDFEGTQDGVKFDGGSAEDYKLEIGSNQFIPGFEDQMVGMKVDEVKDINVTFPEHYQAENLAGKPAVFKVTLHKIEKKVVPALDDEFAKESEREGVTDVASYKKSIKEELNKRAKLASDQKFYDDVISKVAHSAKVEIPEVLVEQRKEKMIENIANQAKQYGIPYETLLSYYGTTKEQYEASVKKSAEESVLQEVVVDAIMKKEKVELSEAEIDEAYAKIAAEDNTTVEEEKKNYPLDNVMNYFLMQKTRQMLVDAAVKTDKDPVEEAPKAKKATAKKTAEKKPAAKKATAKKTAEKKPAAKKTAAKKAETTEAKPKAARKPRAKKEVKEEK